MQNEIRRKITKGLKDSPVNIVSVVLFGSSVKGEYTEDSDIDLLVIANNIPQKRNKRHKEIIAIKKKLYSLGISFDILLLNADECISNFKNHNPLFLDITDEGVVIVDNKNFITTLIDETKEYIKNKKIKKVENGWIFPVTERIPSMLSRVSNKDFAMAMLNDGKRDFEIGKKIAESGYYDKAIYHFQQSIEKAVKATLICFGIFKKTHFIGEVLLKELEDKEIDTEWGGKLIKISNISMEIEPEMTWSRYPGIDNDTLWIPYEEYTKVDALGFKEKCETVIKIVQDFIFWWFK